MRAPKIYVVSVLITICTLMAAGYAQTNSARTGPEAINTQDSSPTPSSSEERTATSAVPNSANNPGQAQPGNQIGAMSSAQCAAPANPPAADQHSLLVAASPESQAGIPQRVLFEFLFDNISALDQVADSDGKAGTHTSAALWRTH